MTEMHTKKSIRKTVCTAVLCASLAFVCAFSTYAYFSTRAVVYTGDGRRHFAQVGMCIDLLFDQLNSDPDRTQLRAGTKMSTGADYDPDAAWGSAANPYIISDIRHLQNLSALQEVGYFDEVYIQDNFTYGSYNGGKHIPYFLVCEPDGTPATIDGTNVTFSPIGNDTYPFYGFVGGSFIGGETTVDGKASDTSAIYNLTVLTDTDVIDVGLFGTIGFLGNEPQDASDNFEGQFSTVQDLLLYDVKIRVNEPSLLDTVGGLFADHRFLKKMVSADVAVGMPEENHHIGILAGHVEYANVNFISVYYSGDDVTAIDVAHTGTYNGKTANYMSASGIIGFIYNMNPEVTDGVIGAGTGTSNDTISINSAIGSGGGLLSGSGRGYVSASEIYDLYDPHNDSNLILAEATDESGKPLVNQYYRKRFFFGGTQTTDYYYFYDGVFTFGLSTRHTSGAPNTDKIEKTWEGNTADTFTVGENDDSKWKKNTTKGNNIIVAYVKDINNTSELETAIGSGKQIYIGYDLGSDVGLMSLYNSEEASSGALEGIFSQNDKYTTEALKNSWIKDTEVINSICQTLQYMNDNIESAEDGILPFDSKEKNQYLIDNINQYKMINLGSGDNLGEIKVKYPIKAVKLSNGKYTLQNNSNYLSVLIKRSWFFGYYYTTSIWTGPSVPSGYKWTNEMDISFDNGIATVSGYFNGGSWGSNAAVTRYVQYDSNENIFKGNADPGTYTSLHLYTVEGTSNLQFGEVTYDPSAGSESATYNADEVLLWPQETYSDNGQRTADHAAYALRKLESSEVEGINHDLKAVDGWKNRLGEPLDHDDLDKKFHMQEGNPWSVTLTGLGGDISIGDNGTIVAPIGSNGKEANIPLGMIAFRINKEAPAGSTNKINVIVSVPVCQYYENEKINNNDVTGGFYKGGLHYFGLWQVPANGDRVVSTFTRDNAIEKFELPRSHPYDPGSTARDSDYILIDNEDGTTSRCYLNGNRVLVAYTFNVTSEGVYLLGSTNGPMEIVYFSADCAASGGRDGTNGSKLGSIDFVYDHNNRVVTVKEDTPDTVPDPNNNGEDYDYYYASMCLLYTDNGAAGLPDINNTQINVWRYVSEDESGDETAHMRMTAAGEDAAYIKLKPHSTTADIVD